MYGIDVDPASVAVTTGSSGAFLFAFLAAFDAGDTVALARPGYPAYRNMLTALGCRVVELPVRRRDPVPADGGAAGGAGRAAGRTHRRQPGEPHRHDGRAG